MKRVMVFDYVHAGCCPQSYIMHKVIEVDVEDASNSFTPPTNPRCATSNIDLRVSVPPRMEVRPS